MIIAEEATRGGGEDLAVHFGVDGAALATDPDFGPKEGLLNGEC